jgi:hypothetical protein
MTAKKFLERIEKGDKFEDIVRDEDREAKQIEYILKALDMFPLRKIGKANPT